MDAQGIEASEVKHITKAAGKYKLLTKEETYALIRPFQAVVQRQVELEQAGDKKGAKALLSERKKYSDTLVLHNLRLIIDTARSFRNKGQSLSELISEGTDGIIHAAVLFDCSRNLAFSTYATLWIKQRMFKAVDYKSRLLRLPPTIVAQVTKLKKVYFQWCSKYCKDPTPHEISEEFKRLYNLDITAEQCEELGRLDAWMLSLDLKVSEEEDLTVGSFVPASAKYDPEKEPDHPELQVILKHLDKLPTEDQDYIKMRYGVWVDSKVRTDREMSQIMGITLKAAKQKTVRIIKELQEHIDKSELTGEYMRTVAVSHINDQVISVYQRILGKPPATYVLPLDIAEELACEVEVAGGRCTLS